MNLIQFQIQLGEDNIIQYANSIDAPLQRKGGELIAPSTMPVTFWKIEDAPWLSMQEPLIHGMQHFSYEMPLTAGMHLDCELGLIKVEQKNGSQNVLTLYTHALVCFYRGKVVATGETVLIRIGGMR
jgi:hypothetical protein